MACLRKQSQARAPIRINCCCNENNAEVKTENEMMKKSLVSVLVVVGMLLVCSVSVVGQQPASQSPPGADAQTNTIKDQDIEMLRANLRAQRKQIMAENMTLTADEATKFWPIFDQYRKEAIKPNDERWAVIKDYATNYNTMTDAQAQDYMNRSTAVDQQLLALRMKYVPIFEKVISPKKTALCYRISPYRPADQSAVVRADSHDRYQEVGCMWTCARWGGSNPAQERKHVSSSLSPWPMSPALAGKHFALDFRWPFLCAR